MDKKLLPMSFRSDELSDGVSKGGVRADVINRKGVLSIVHAPSGEDDGDEVNAGILKQRGGT